MCASEVQELWGRMLLAVLVYGWVRYRDYRRGAEEVSVQYLDAWT